MLLYRFLHCGDMPFAIAKLKTRTGSPVSFGIESFFTCSACGAYLVGLILWGVVASVLMVISNRWTKRIFWIAAMKKTNTLIVLNLLSMVAVRYWQKLHYRLPGLYIQKQLSLVCFIVVVLGTAVAIGRDWHRNGYNFLLWHLPYRIVAALIFSNVAFMVFAGYWFGAGVS